MTENAVPAVVPLPDAPGATARLGIIGGGQLARMTTLAALNLGCEVSILESTPQSPAARLAAGAWVGEWKDDATLQRFAASVDVVTVENEFVDADALARLEDAGRLVFPTSRSLAVTQDKLRQKEALVRAGVPVAKFRQVDSPDDVRAAAGELGWPLVLKTRRHGYDGKGNVTIRNPVEIDAAWARLGGADLPKYVEAFFPFTRELAVIVTRERDGGAITYPTVETIQQNHICHQVIAPAEVTPSISLAAAALAKRAVASVDGIGSFGVEMFLSTDGELVVNELAPRVHNSGHYSIEACACSQFENHVRAVLGLPLGSPDLITPAAAMVNLLGAGEGPGRPTGLNKALAVPGAHVHLYGKSQSRAGRKMGHVTALGETRERALALAQQAAQSLRFGTSHAE